MEKFQWDELEYEPVEEPEEEPEEDSEESWEGGEDSYLDASWEDRFEMDMGDYWRQRGGESRPLNFTQKAPKNCVKIF